MDFLKAEQARGVSHVYLDEETRSGLRAWLRRGQAAATPNAASAGPKPATLVQAATLPDINPDGSTKAERLASLRQQAATWAPARALGTLRETMVFAAGSPDARLMLVGEAPGYEEEKQGEPFVGPAGKKLDDILKAMGLTRDEVYLSSMVKYRPATARQTTNNRKPSPEEMAACLPFIRAEIAVVRPACIVALGVTAAEGLLGLSGSVGAMRGAWHTLDGIPVRVTHHPAYLLQSGTNLSMKRQVWEDMLMVMEELIMPISAKQRAFFLPKD
jgi:DNA polymerase